MQKIFIQILDWSEVWGLFIPLSVLLFKKKQPAFLRPVIIYLMIALPLNLFIDIIWKFKTPYNFPGWLQTNNYLYNLHSILRFVLFSLFFIKLKQPFLATVKKITPVIFWIFVFINFIILENFFRFDRLSSRLLSVESALLLLYSLQYYFYKFQDESDASRSSDFWIVTGLCIYSAASFPIYLFYETLLRQSEDFTILIWKVPDICYIIFCIFIAKGFYESKS